MIPLEKHLFWHEAILILIIFHFISYFVGSCIIGFICWRKKFNKVYIAANLLAHFIGAHSLTVLLFFSGIIPQIFVIFNCQYKPSIIFLDGIIAEIIILTIHFIILRRK